MSRSSYRVMLSVSVFILHQIFVASANIFISLIIQMTTRSQIAERAAVLTHYLVDQCLQNLLKKLPLSITLIVLDVRKLSSHVTVYH